MRTLDMNGWKKRLSPLGARVGLGLLVWIVAWAPLAGLLGNPGTAYAQSNIIYAPGLSAGASMTAPEDPEDTNPQDPDPEPDPDDELPWMPGDELSPEARLVILQEMSTQLDDVVPAPTVDPATRDLEAELFSMADALLELPDVVTTVVQTETLVVHAILRDGMSIAVINNRPPGSDDSVDADAAAIAREFAPEPVASQDLDVASVPGNVRAVAANFDGGDSVRAAVGNKLSEAGYSVLGLGADIASMRSYTNLGALYLDTHGASFLRVTGFITNSEGTRSPQIEGSFYALQTSTTVSASALTDSAYLDDLTNGRIVVSFVQTKSGWEAQLAITERFIQRYWSFSDGIVMIHACFGGSGPFNPNGSCFGACSPGDQGVFDPTPLRLAMIGKGAKAVVSFDNYTNADVGRENILYFYDRMLGQNQVRPQNPPARPFPIDEVQIAMAQAGLLRFNKPSFVLGPFGFGGNDVNLTFTVTSDDKAALAPTIQYVDVVDDADQGQGEFTLVGEFGATQGTVELAGTPLTVRSWSDKEIVADAPFNLTGDLVVKAPGNVSSNKVPITLWSGELTYSLKGTGTLEARTTLNLRFRADVHRFRSALTGTPETRVVETYVAPPSTGETRGLGSYTVDDTTIIYSGNRAMILLGKAGVDGFSNMAVPADMNSARENMASVASLDNEESQFGGIVRIDPATNQVRLCIIGLSVHQQSIEGVEFDVPFNTLGFSQTGLWNGSRGFLSCVNLTLQNTYGIPAGTRTISMGDANIELRWSNFAPQNAPQSDTPG